MRGLIVQCCRKKHPNFVHYNVELFVIILSLVPGNCFIAGGTLLGQKTLFYVVSLHSGVSLVIKENNVALV